MSVKESPKLYTCQDCGGAGRYYDVILDDGTGPWHGCGWCKGSGQVTGPRRSGWLRCQKEAKAPDD